MSYLLFLVCLQVSWVHIKMWHVAAHNYFYLYFWSWKKLTFLNWLDVKLDDLNYLRVSFVACILFLFYFLLALVFFWFLIFPVIYFICSYFSTCTSPLTDKIVICNRTIAERKISKLFSGIFPLLLLLKIYFGSNRKCNKHSVIS